MVKKINKKREIFRQFSKVNKLKRERSRGKKNPQMLSNTIFDLKNICVDLLK